MSATLINQQLGTNPIRLRCGHNVAARAHGLVPNEPRPSQHVTDDEELSFVAKAAFIIAILAMFPLVLFSIFSYVCPDFLLFPITAE